MIEIIILVNNNNINMNSNNTSKFIYSIIEQDNIDSFIISSLNSNINSIFIDIFYYISSIISYGNTQGEIITRTSMQLDTNSNKNKIYKVLMFISKVLLKKLAAKRNITKIIYEIVDLVIYVIFIGSNQMIGMNILDYVFRPRYICNNENTNDGQFLKKIIWDEISKMIVMILPLMNRGISVIKNTKLCCICRNDICNKVGFKCGHCYCYYCYQKRKRYIGLKEEKCLICK